MIAICRDHLGMRITLEDDFDEEDGGEIISVDIEDEENGRREEDDRRARARQGNHSTEVELTWYAKNGISDFRPQMLYQAMAISMKVQHFLQIDGKHVKLGLKAGDGELSSQI